MSQENDLNVDEILEQIKSLSQKLKDNNWNGIPRYRIRLYGSIILALEENNVNKMRSSLLSASRLLLNDVCEYQNPNIVKLDVDIVMKLTEKLLERANNIDINITECVEFLLDILGVAMQKYRNSLVVKITVQDIENCISLVDKVFASSDSIKTNIVVLTKAFNILNHVIWNCDENKKSESVSKVIEFVEIVEKDERIKWDNIKIRSVFLALRNISEKSESLSPDQATKIFNMTTAFVGKIDDLGALTSTCVCEMLINPLRDMLCKKNNPAKIDVKQCLDLVKQILNKSDIVHHPNMGLELMKAVTDIISYYGRDEENKKDIDEYGFDIQNGEIMSFDEIKLKEFVSEKMFDTFENYLRNELDAIEVTDNVIDNKYGAKVNVNVPSNDQDLSKVQQNIEVHKANLNDDQNKNNDVIEDKYSPTINVDMPLDSQNLSEVQQKTFDNNDMAEAEREQSTSFNRSQSACAPQNNIKVVVMAKKQEGLLNSKSTKTTDAKRQNKKVLNVIYNGRNDPNKKNRVQFIKKNPTNFDQIFNGEPPAAALGGSSMNIDNINLIKNNTEAENEEPVSDANEKISNSNQFGIDNNNNQFLQTGVQNNANSFEQPTKENENKESQKNDNKNNETEKVQKRKAEYESVTTAGGQANSIKTPLEEDGSINKFSQLNVNNQPVQTGNGNKSTKSDSEVNENNKSNEVQKHEDEYEPTKMLVVLAVLSLFIPVIPGLIFVIVHNKQKEPPLTKVLVFIPIVSPIIFGIKTYQAYQLNKVLKAKKVLAETDSAILKFGDKTNSFQNVQDMQAQKSKTNNVKGKDENEKSRSTKDISDLNLNDTK